MAQSYNRDDLLIAEFKEAFNEFDKVWIFVSQAQAQTMSMSTPDDSLVIHSKVPYKNL